MIPAEIEYELQKRHADRLSRDLKRFAITQDAVTKLRAAGLTNESCNLHNYNWFHIYLNPQHAKDGRAFFKNTKTDQRALAAQLLKYRKALGVRLKVVHKSVYNAQRRLVNVHLEPEGYPDVRIIYVKRLKRNARCKIQTTRIKSTEVVCSIN